MRLLRFTAHESFLAPASPQLFHRGRTTPWLHIPHISSRRLHTHTHTHSGTHTYSCGQWKHGLNAGGHIATFRPNQITLRSRGLSLFYITIRKWSRVAFSRLTLLPVSCKLTGYITKKICFPHYFRYKREMYVLCCFMRQSYVCKEIIFVS